MSRKTIWIVVTGQIRKAKYFKRSLAQFLSAREQGLVDGIVFSTWAGEVDPYPGLRTYLKQNGITLVENTPLVSPTADLGGNIERQKLLLFRGLNFVPKDCHVFKTRPDQVISVTERFNDLLLYLQEMDLSVAPEDRAILPARIWCGRLAFNVPLWYDDRYFFTTFDVALRMAQNTTDLRVLGHPDNNIAELNWYQPLFARCAYWPHAVMQINWMAVAFQPSEAEIKAYQSALMESQFYWLAIALFEQATERFFRIGCPGFEMEDYDFLGPDPRRVAELPMVFGRFAEFYNAYIDNPYFAQARTQVTDLLSDVINDPALWREALHELSSRNPQYSDFFVKIDHS